MKTSEFKRLKYVTYSLIDNKTELIYIMAWHRIGDNPLFDPIMT